MDLKFPAFYGRTFKLCLFVAFFFACFVKRGLSTFLDDMLKIKTCPKQFKDNFECTVDILQSLKSNMSN